MEHAHKLIINMRIQEAVMKRPKNLSLEADAVARGERYGKLHGKPLSQLVNDFLRALPLEPSSETVLSPVVRRLRGVAAGAKVDRATHRKHLARKYGSR
jgi:hypothetical protein